MGQAAAEEEEPRTFAANSGTASGRIQCPVPGCAIGKVGRGFRDSYALRSHFRYQHSWDTVGTQWWWRAHATYDALHVGCR